jgi:hypothetical protein
MFAAQMPQLTLSVLEAPLNRHRGCKVPAKASSARARVGVRSVTCASWKTAVTEAVTAVPIWIVTRLVDGLNQSDSDGPCPQAKGMYEDPQQHACVRTCAEGWEWDEETRSCVPDPCLTGFSWDEQDEFCLPAAGFGAPETSNIPPYNPATNSHVDYFNYPRPRRPLSPPTFSNAKYRSNIAPAAGDRKQQRLKCPPGYYMDPNNADACTPICKPGYTFDTRLKRCVSEV